MPPAAVYSVHAHHYDYVKADQLNLDIPQPKDHSALGHCYSAEELGLQDNAEALLLSERRSIDSLPASIAHGIKHGLVSKELLQQYLHYEQHKLFRYLLCVPGMTPRLLGDPTFLMKLSVEAGVGVLTKLLAEMHKRPVKFWLELDFVFANVIMSLLSDIMLIWAPAPQAILSRQQPRHQSKSGRLASARRWLDSCPDNAFQVAKADRMQWSIAQRTASFVKSSIVLFIVGLVSSILGVGVINCLVAMKTLIGSHAAEIALSQEVLAISVAHGVYMATSGNVRYQILAGIVEERGIDKIFAHRQSVLKALTFIIRSVNTYYGSAHWIVFIRLLGLQDE